jgi:DNA-binding HxlR family transcriptional regulator
VAFVNSYKWLRRVTKSAVILDKEEQMKRIDCKPGVDRDDYCSIESALDVIGGKWSFLVLHELFEGTRRFGELKRCISEVSPKALTETLRHLEESGIVMRCAYATIPPTVEYSLTEKGLTLLPILREMKVWGARWT